MLHNFTTFPSTLASNSRPSGSAAAVMKVVPDATIVDLPEITSQATVFVASLM
jgi:hypothetical protein